MTCVSAALSVERRFYGDQAAMSRLDWNGERPVVLVFFDKECGETIILDSSAFLLNLSGIRKHLGSVHLAMHRVCRERFPVSEWVVIAYGGKRFTNYQSRRIFMSGSFEIKKATDGQFYFHLKAGNGEIILSSEMYEAKASAEKGIASVQVNSPLEERYHRDVAKNGKLYFTLKAANAQVIGNSQMYASAANRDAGIDSVKANGSTKVIKDLS